MPVGSTLLHSVQVLGFSDIGHLTLQQRLNRFLFVRPAFCLRLASGRHPEISPRDEHPCRSASTSPCRVCRGLSPPSHRLTTTMNRTVLSHYAPCPAHKRKKLPAGSFSGLESIGGGHPVRPGLVVSHTKYGVGIGRNRFLRNALTIQ